MTCRHVIGLIDAGPLADYPQEHLDAARAHARACATCGPVLEAATSLSNALGALPLTATPRNFTDRVMARIAAEEPSVVEPAIEPASRINVAATALSPWANAAGLAASVVALVWSMAESGGEGLGLQGMAISITPDAKPLFVTGLIVYVASLFSASAIWSNSTRSSSHRSSGLE